MPEHAEAETKLMIGDVIEKHEKTHFYILRNTVTKTNYIINTTNKYFGYYQINKTSGQKIFMDLILNMLWRKSTN